MTSRSRVGPQKSTKNDDKLIPETKTFCEHIFLGVEKLKAATRPKRVLLKFRADQSYPRVVNGHSKFRKRAWR